MVQLTADACEAEPPAATDDPHGPLSTAPARPRGSLLPAAAAGLLLLWSVVGAASTATHLANPAIGWRVTRPDAARGVVGLPLARADEVTVIRDLLGSTARETDEAWLVVYPPDVDPTELGYVRAQLMYHEYPRRVDVAMANAPLPEVRYDGVITHPAIAPRGLPAPAHVLGGFSAFRLAQ